MSRRIVLLAGLLSFARAAHSQSPAEHIALGDHDRAALAAASALKHYEAALAVEPNNYDALIKAAYDAVDLGEFNPNDDQRTALYRSAEQYARRAVAANPDGAESHFQLALALGRAAQTMGAREKVKLAAEVRAQALAALERDPRHSGALHVMGMWNAEVMRLSRVSRMIAKNFLGGGVLEEASWDRAQKYLEDAVALEPKRITHRRDLAAIYADRGQTTKAIEQYDWIVKAPPADYNDGKYKAEAKRRLERLR